MARTYIELAGIELRLEPRGNSMRVEMQGHVYPPYRLRPDRGLARKFMSALGVNAEPRNRRRPISSFFAARSWGLIFSRIIHIPREKALHGGQRYEWFSPVSFDDEFVVTARVENKIVEKEGKRGKVWFADGVDFEYRLAQSGELAVREVTRLVEQS